MQTSQLHNRNVLFEEVQEVARKPVRRFAALLAILFATGWVINLVQIKNGDEGSSALYFVGLLISAPAFVIMQIRMVTQVREDGIYVRLPFLQPAFSIYRWADIRHLYIRKYYALQEYGGWGIRYNAAGKAYILWGNTGLQLELHNGKKVLIGTLNPQQLEAVLQALR